MAEEVRIWEIQSTQHKESLQELPLATLNFEARLEKWLEDDISIISKNFLIIGKQVKTDFFENKYGYIDLLCINSEGNIIILELKRNMTPREVVAQTLDYASWIKNLSYDQIIQIGDGYYNGIGAFENKFQEKFGFQLPEDLNVNHEMYIVGSNIDPSSERIINYLSESYSVAINAVKFQYHRNEQGSEFLARIFLIEPDVAKKRLEKADRKRRPALTFEELEDAASERGVGDIYKLLLEGLNRFFINKYRTREAIVFASGQNRIFYLVLLESNQEKGLKYNVCLQRFASYFKISEEEATKLFPIEKEDWTLFKGAPPEYSGFSGFFKDLLEVEKFIEALSNISKVNTS